MRQILRFLSIHANRCQKTIVHMDNAPTNIMQRILQIHSHHIEHRTQTSRLRVIYRVYNEPPPDSLMIRYLSSCSL
jgi:hypothetical protein